MARRTIVTVGRGRSSRAPDRAEVRVGIQLTRPTATSARTDAAAGIAGVLAAIRGLGIDDGDIRTAQLSLGASWEYPPSGKPTLAGYQATNQLRVIVHDLDRVAALVDAAIGAGATTLDGVDFGLTDAAMQAASVEALNGAMADARAKGDTLAARAGLRIGGVLRIEERAGGAAGPLPMYRMMEASAADTPVMAGTSEVEAVVHVAFEVEPA